MTQMPKIASLFLLFSFSVFSQINREKIGNKLVLDKIINNDSTSIQKGKKSIATYNQYRIISLSRDTTFVDTSLTIQKEYKFNYLRKDIFGLLPFANEGQPYTVLDFKLKNRNTFFPEIGFSGKHFNYLRAEDIQYYSVATPVTELYFKTVMNQGQSLDALVTLNTSERFNFSFAYKGLRSLGRYINQLSSTGNFRVTASYNTANANYYLKSHFASQDFLNGENGGIISTNNFESENPEFQNRERLAVYLTDAKTFMKGKRFFIDHYYKLKDDLFITHQFNYETKNFEYNQIKLSSTVDGSEIKLFGDSSLPSNINDHQYYDMLHNKAGVVYENFTLGKFQFFAEDFRNKTYYNGVLNLDSGINLDKIEDRVNSLGGQYDFKRNNWEGTVLYSESISNQLLKNLDFKLKYKSKKENQFILQIRQLSKLPDIVYNFHQSSYLKYNWINEFKNEKIYQLNLSAKTKWFTSSFQIFSLDNHLYFSNDSQTIQQFITPKQYDKTINYLSLYVAKEFKLGKFALDNTILYQKTSQSNSIINLPQFVLRNTLYFNDFFFKKALYLQTGLTVNYFTEYYVDGYNPVLAESYIQNDKKIGDFPMFDFFINGRIRQTRIFLKAEHFNSKFSGNNFYSAPNYPYRDFMIRFGLVWNFFQ